MKAEKLGVTPSLFILCLSICLAQCGLAGATRERLVKTLTINGRMDLAAFSPDGELVTTVDKTNASSGSFAIKTWQTADARLRYSTDKYGVYGLAVSRDGQILAASCDDGVRLFRMSDGYLLQTLKANQMFTSAFSPDGQTVAAGGAEGEVRVWRVDDGGLVHVYNAKKWITSIAFSPDGQMLAVGTASNIGFVRPSEASSDDNAILLWHIDNSEPLNPLGGHKYGVLTVSFSQDGQTLASGGSDGFVRLWRLANGTLLKSVKIDSALDPAATEHQSVIEQVSFSPDGRFLGVAASDKIFLFAPSELNLISTLKGHTESVLSIVFTRNETVLSASEDSTVRSWQLRRN